jgi:FkbM family methyltransferase
MQLERMNIKGLLFDVRKGTSDRKAVEEVVGRGGYKRKGHEPRVGEHWIDIGANVGAFSVWAATLGATVEGFEPDPESAELAAHNININGLSNVARITTAALTTDSTEGTANLHRNTARGNVWRNSLFKQWRGGDTIQVPTQPVTDYWLPGNCIKLDAEGAEMPILEAQATQPVKKLVFEWSFDIDRSITRFNNVIEQLRNTYQDIHYSKFQEGHEEWPSSWFPPCRTVWCK